MQAYEASPGDEGDGDLAWGITHDDHTIVEAAPTGQLAICRAILKLARKETT
jgi:hypothetical protein